MSPPKACAVNDGTTFASAFMRSGRPADSSSSALSTWIGEELLNASTPVARVPVTMTVSVTSLLGRHRSAACVEAAAAVPALLRSNSAGVHADGTSVVDLNSQLLALLNRLRVSRA